MSLEMNELRRFEADLGRASREVIREGDRVLERGALQKKESLRADAESGGSYRHFAGAISYDNVGLLRYEIGPDKGRTQGALGNILYFGTRNNGAVLDIEAGDAEVQDGVVSHLERVATEVLE